MKSVAVGPDGVVFDLIEVASHLFGCVDAMIEVGDEAGNRTLEVDVVLPEGIVGVDEEGLVGGAASDLIGGVHRLIIRGIVVPIRHSQRATVGMPRLGDVSPERGMPELKAMISTVLAHMEMSNAGFTHDRKPSVSVGYRVWNPFEVELRASTDGQYDQFAQGVTRSISVVK